LYSIGVDIGGTFTDIVIRDASGSQWSAKVPSRRDEPTRAVLEAIAAVAPAVAGLRGDDESGRLNWVERFVHGTTVGTNALLEKKGARVGMLTTAGFRDTLEIQRENKEHLYDLRYHKPKPLVPRDRRLEVIERVDHTGQIVVPLDETQSRATIRQLGDLEVEAVAVCLLFAYVNPDHERRIAQLVAEGLPGVPVCISSDISPVWKEYERFSTTVANAAIQPLVERYLTDLDEGLRACGLDSGLLVMQSSGGLLPMEDARRKPVNLVLSGPAAGAIAGARLAASAGFAHAISLDMGGTSTDVCLSRDGGPAMTGQRELEFGVPLRVTSLDVETIGAGGGSIAWLDKGNGLHVGPESAGARPGPACYGFGGTRPTLTDANVVLNRLSDGQPLGGAPTGDDSNLHLDGALAREAVAAVADDLGLGVEKTALGIVDIAVVSLVQAIRIISIERGHDPRDFTLVAFGGAGPLHAVAVADELGIPSILVPPEPGVTSALGLLLTDVRHDYATTLFGRLDIALLPRLRDAWSHLERTGVDQLRRDAVAEADSRVAEALDVRYVGQTHEITVELAAGHRELSAETLPALEQAIHATHERLFGFALTNEPVEVVNIRLSAIGATGESPRTTAAAHMSARKAGVMPQPGRTQRVYFDQGWLATAVYSRTELPVGAAIRGPAIVVQSDTTVLVPPGHGAVVDAHANLVIEGRGGSHADE
jgi:N-methylhydantoinase A